MKLREIGTLACVLLTGSMGLQAANVYYFKAGLNFNSAGEQVAATHTFDLKHDGSVSGWVLIGGWAGKVQRNSGNGDADRNFRVVIDGADVGHDGPAKRGEGSQPGDFASVIPFRASLKAGKHNLALIAWDCRIIADASTILLCENENSEAMDRVLPEIGKAIQDIEDFADEIAKALQKLRDDYAVDIPELGRRTEANRAAIEALLEELKKLKALHESLENYVNSINNNTIHLSNRVQRISNRLAHLKRQFNASKKRINLLFQKVNDLSKAVADLQAQQSALQSTVQSNYDELSGRINKLDRRVDRLSHQSGSSNTNSNQTMGIIGTALGGAAMVTAIAVPIFQDRRTERVNGDDFHYVVEPRGDGYGQDVSLPSMGK